MRQLLTGTLIILSLNAVLAQAQQSAPKLNYESLQDNLLLKTNPFTVLVGPLFPFSSQYGLTAEIVHGVNQSSLISAAYLGKGLLVRAIQNSPGMPANFDQWIFRGYRFQLAHRFYLLRDVKENKLAPSGFYIGPHASLASMKISEPFLNQFQSYLRGTEFNANLLLGVQLNFFGLYLDTNFGLGYKRNFWQETQGNQTSNIPLQDLGYGPFYRSNLKIHVGFETGYAF